MDTPPVTSKSVGRAGFTLIEMSIVLVIIGLIIGGVLVGQDLIYSAAIRSQISQIEKYTTAVNTFRSKYDCLPGDCAKAVSFGLGKSGGPGDNGDGDGNITNKCLQLPWYWAVNNGSESVNFWYHLAQSGLTEGGFAGFGPSGAPGSLIYNVAPSAVFPTAKINPLAVIVPSFFNCGTDVYSGLRTGGNGFVLGTMQPGSNPGQVGFDSVANPAVTYAQAYQIDSKIDDGLPLSGSVGIMEYWYSEFGYANIANTSAAGEPCATSGNNYILNSAYINVNGYAGPARCNLAFINKF